VTPEKAEFLQDLRQRNEKWRKLLDMLDGGEINVTRNRVDMSAELRQQFVQAIQTNERILAEQDPEGLTVE
jgi:glucose-6-phosphate isomerase